MVDSTDRADKAFDYAQDTTKQALVLATGIIAITVAFVGDLKKASPRAEFCLLHAGWIADAVSVIFGVATLMALTGHLGTSDDLTPNTIYAGNIKVLSIIQLLTFLIALGFTVAFGISAT